MKPLVLILCLAPFLQAAPPQPKVHDHAVVTFHMGNGVPLSVARRITVKGKEFAELKSLFPEAGSGKKGGRPAGWTSWATIELRGKQTVKVSVSHDGRRWSYDRGMGDFWATPGAKSYLQGLEKRAKAIG